MTEQFIQKAKLIHGDKYNYSKVNYKKAIEKVVIICLIHKDFEITPNSHLNGSGCILCGKISSSNKQSLNILQFITKSKEKHGDNYDYSKVEYINSQTKVNIICKTHGEFEQIPNNHIRGKGCIKCSGNYKYSTDEWIIMAKELHGDNYDYSKAIYKNANEKIIIICKIHGEFKQTPRQHLNGSGCIKCGIISSTNKQTFSKEEFIKKSKEKHNDKYDYSKIEYINSQTKVKIICKTHGEFEQIPNGHIRGRGCIKCGGCDLKTTKEFIEQSKQVHGDKYDYSKTIYTIAKNPIIITCNKCGDFEQMPNVHLYGCGCNKCCNSKKYSKAQINWLNFIQIKDDIHIEHAENGKEFIIPTTRFKADGYCRTTNTIYEYHGTYWHGDPKKFNTNEINKTTKCTFGELYKKTLEKEEQIKNLGYNLVVIWESDWNKINKSIKTLQKKFRNSKH